MSIVITGTPGVGKHTIAKEVVKLMNFSLVDVNKIAIESGLLKKNEKTNDIDPELLKKIINEIASEPKLIVGHLAPYTISPELVKLVIVLRRSPYELLSVYKERNYDEKKIKENLGSEILGIIVNDCIEEFSLEKIIQVDISEKSLSSNVEKILQIIRGKKESEFVDWLEEIKENDDLKKFFSY